MTFRIAGWDKWQTYRKDRGTPPWIKVHRNLMTNPEWADLTDAEKGQLVSIWIVAADKAGEIASNPSKIMKMCQLDSEPNINRFIELGFIESTGCHDDAKVTPLSQPSDAPETETETETDKPKRKTHAHFDAFWSVYPNKKDKKKSKMLWGNRNLDSMAASIIADVKNRITNDDQWKKGFIPMPTTYINGDRWDDSVSSDGGIEKQWHETSTGIEAKAVELDIVQAEREAWPNFKIRVYKAAGFNPDATS